VKIKNLIDDYYKSFDFKELRDGTKEQYKYFLQVVMDTNVENKNLGSRNIEKISTRMAKLAYNEWCQRGISMANFLLSTTRIVYNYAIHMEICNTNPFSAVKKRVTKRRKVVWSKEQVKKFLDTAYSNFGTRNVGLIAQMAYEWCQRLGDMRLLTWDNIDFSTQRVYIEQSKRRAEVFLPISDELFEMLKQQQADFGFQKYVAPSTLSKRGKYNPYSLTNLPKAARRVIMEANLPNTLRLSDLRRTGTTEMVEAGVSIGNIMAVTGHANPQSVKPYMKNTFASADYALTKRKNCDNNI